VSTTKQYHNLSGKRMELSYQLKGALLLLLKQDVKLPR